MHTLKFLSLTLLLFSLGCMSRQESTTLSESESQDVPVQSLTFETDLETSSAVEPEPSTEPELTEAALPQLVAKPILETPVVEPDGLHATSLGEITPVHKLDEIYLAGQPTEQDIAVLKENGFKTIISLRKSEEVSWDEADAIEKQGIQFVHVPFQGEGELTPEVFDKVLKTLCDKEQQPLLLHCGSANRVSALWYAHRVLNGNLNHEEAQAEARTAGLRNEAYLDKAREYVLAEQLLGGRKSDSEE